MTHRTLPFWWIRTFCGFLIFLPPVCHHYHYMMLRNTVVNINPLYDGSTSNPKLLYQRLPVQLFQPPGILACMDSFTKKMSRYKIYCFIIYKAFFDVPVELEKRCKCNVRGLITRDVNRCGLEAVARITITIFSLDYSQVLAFCYQKLSFPLEWSCKEGKVVLNFLKR